MDAGLMSASFTSISFAGSMYWYLWPAVMGGTSLALWLRTRRKAVLIMAIGFLVSALAVAIAHSTPNSSIDNYTGDPNKLFEAMQPVNQGLHIFLALTIQAGFVLALMGFVITCVHIARGTAAGEAR